LTPLGILHIAAFMTLCEAYMGIGPHFDLWNYFFHARLQLGSNTEAVVWDNVVSLAASMSVVAELLKGQINVVASNRVR
jgi:hypothetical protein